MNVNISLYNYVQDDLFSVSFSCYLYRSLSQIRLICASNSTQMCLVDIFATK